MNYIPLRDFVLVVRETSEEKTESGLIFKPQTVEDKIVKALVVAVGSGRVAENGAVVPMEVKVGDRVMFNKSFAVELTGSGETALVVREEQLFCIIRA